MKIVITENQLRKLISEISDDKLIKTTQDVDIIYEDDDVIIYVPLTHETSCVLDKDTKWCTAKPGPIHPWFKLGKNKLFRFKFNDGYKLRLTWNDNGKLYWADKNNLEVDFDYGSNPFDWSMLNFNWAKGTKYEKHFLKMKDKVNSLSDEAKKVIKQYKHNDSKNN